MVCTPWSRRHWDTMCSPATTSCSSIDGGIAARSFIGTGMGWLSGRRSKNQTTPISSYLQKPANSPIISLAGLLQLVEWMQAQQLAVKEGVPCHETPSSMLPPARSDREAAADRPTLGPADARTARQDAARSHRRCGSTTGRAACRTGGAR